MSFFCEHSSFVHSRQVLQPPQNVTHPVSVYFTNEGDKEKSRKGPVKTDTHGEEDPLGTINRRVLSSSRSPVLTESNCTLHSLIPTRTGRGTRLVHRRTGGEKIPHFPDAHTTVPVEPLSSEAKVRDKWRLGGSVEPLGESNVMTIETSSTFTSTSPRIKCTVDRVTPDPAPTLTLTLPFGPPTIEGCHPL